jgi:two-component sensor histidine kinase
MSLYNQIARAKITLLDSVVTNEVIAKKSLLIEANEYAQKAWKCAKELGDQDDLLRAATSLSVTYERLGNDSKALFYAKEQARLGEEVNAKAKTASMAEMMTKYDTEKVESENELLKQQEIANNAKLKQQQLFTTAGIIVAGLLAILAIVIYRSREKVKVAQAVTQKTLTENELLLKVIHHRVKNNLQIVSSLLNLQTNQSEDEAALSAMADGQNRVQAMALIHQGLYQTENLDKIHFQEYAQKLLEQLASLYPNSNKVQREVLASDVRLDIDTAVPLGLILNELITNTFKYAFEDIENGSLQIALNQKGNNEYALTVSDNGKGLPENFNLKKARSIGLKLIKGLSKQLYGSFDYQYENGAKFTVTFKDTELRKQMA